MTLGVGGGILVADIRSAVASPRSRPDAARHEARGSLHRRSDASGPPWSNTSTALATYKKNPGRLCARPAPTPAKSDATTAQSHKPSPGLSISSRGHSTTAPADLPPMSLPSHKSDKRTDLQSNDHRHRLSLSVLHTHTIPVFSSRVSSHHRTSNPAALFLEASAVPIGT